MANLLNNKNMLDKVRKDLGLESANNTSAPITSINGNKVYSNNSLKTPQERILDLGQGPIRTSNETPSANKILGEDDETYRKRMNSSFKESQDSKNAMTNAASGLDKLSGLVEQDSIVSKETKNKMNGNFTVPAAVKEADAYLAKQLEKIQSGKTSYSGQVKNMLDKIMGREKFSYDVDSDPLFQQALASSMNSGKQAMQDTIGQASALTGGYGSTYATTAGNQAYNAFIEDAYNNLPQYYQMALNAYQMEGEEMYRQFGALSELDDKEFNRNVTAYDATYQHRNQLWNEAYTLHRDSVNDAFAMADFELAEHGQLVSDAYNYYSASSDYADRLYEREYNKWINEMDLILKNLEINNKEAWANKEFNEGVRQFDITTQKNEEHFTRELEHNSAENALSREHSSAENALQREHDSAENQKMLDFEATESAKNDVWNLLQQGITPSLELLEKAGMPFDEETAKLVAETMKAYLEEAGYSSGGYSSRGSSGGSSKKNTSSKGGSGSGYGGYYDYDTIVEAEEEYDDSGFVNYEEPVVLDDSKIDILKPGVEHHTEKGTENYQDVMDECLEIKKNKGTTAALEAAKSAYKEGRVNQATYMQIVNKIRG